MVRVSDEWLNHTVKNGVDRTIGDYYNVLCALEELQARRKAEKERECEKITDAFWRKVRDSVREAEKERGHTDNSANEKDGAVLPIPCTKGYEEWTVKQWFAKINEELDEMKEAMLRWSDLDSVSLDCDYVEKSDIALVDEAADTITAITSMLEAMGIDEQARQAAQRRVNAHNRQRGRL